MLGIKLRTALKSELNGLHENAMHGTLMAKTVTVGHVMYLVGKSPVNRLLIFLKHIFLEAEPDS